MYRLGLTLFIIGIGSFVLPLFHVQFLLVELVEDQQPWVGIILTVLGLILLAVAAHSERE